MAVTNEVYLLTVLLAINYLFLYKTHPWVASIFTILLGGASLIFITANNIMGILIIMMGIITLLGSPWDESSIIKGRFS